MKWPVELVTVTPTFTRFTEMRMGGVCCWVCAAKERLDRAKRTEQPGVTVPLGRYGVLLIVDL